MPLINQTLPLGSPAAPPHRPLGSSLSCGSMAPLLGKLFVFVLNRNNYNIYDIELITFMVTQK